MTADSSNGYEGIAGIFLARRGKRPVAGDAIGAATVRAWAEALPAGATVRNGARRLAGRMLADGAPALRVHNGDRVFACRLWSLRNGSRGSFRAPCRHGSACAAASPFRASAGRAGCALVRLAHRASVRIALSGGCGRPARTLSVSIEFESAGPLRCLSVFVSLTHCGRSWRSWRTTVVSSIRLAGLPGRRVSLPTRGRRLMKRDSASDAVRERAERGSSTTLRLTTRGGPIMERSHRLRARD